MNATNNITPILRASRSTESRFGGLNERGVIGDSNRRLFRSDQPVIAKGDSHDHKLQKRKEPEVITVNLDDIRQRLDHLHTVASKQIRSLSGQELDDYQALVRYMRLLYDTDAYRVYYDQVRQKFEDITSVEPGTVAAFFIGCVPSHAGTSPAGCSATCAGSMPPPPDALGSSHAFCPHTVALAIATPNGYDIRSLYEGDNKSEMVLYVDTRGKDFHGFSEDEKAQLGKYGCDRIKVLKLPS